MDFSWTPDASPSEEIPRLFREQLLGALQASEELERPRAVHEIRKAGKRARAALKLARGGMPKAERRALHVGFRDAARLIGPVRDVDVMRELLLGLGTVGELVLTDSVVELPDDTSQRLARCIEGLRQTMERLEETSFEGIDRACVVRNLGRAYGRARKRRAKAAAGDHHHMHEWRKAVKVFGYQLRLFTGLWPPVLGAWQEELDTLQHTLGDHHDIAVLTQALREAGYLEGKLADGLAARAADLFDLALEQGRPLFAADRSVITGWVADLWSAT